MSGTWAISPPGDLDPGELRSSRKADPELPQIAGSACSVRMKSSIAIGSAPTQITSFTFIATQSIPIVSYRPRRSAMTILVPTVSVDSARPVRSSSRSTLA